MINNHLINNSSAAVQGADISFCGAQKKIRTPIGIMDDIFPVLIFTVNHDIVSGSPLGGFHENDDRIFIFEFLVNNTPADVPVRMGGYQLGSFPLLWPDNQVMVENGLLGEASGIDAYAVITENHCHGRHRATVIFHHGI